MRRVSLLLALLLLLTACGGGGDRAEPTAPIADAAPTEPTEDTATPDPTATPTPIDEPSPTEPDASDDAEDEPADGTASGATTARAFLTRVDDSGFWVEPVTAALAEPTVAVARAAYELMVSHATDDPELSSITGPGVEVLDVAIDGDLLTVDLSGQLRENGGGSSAEAALVQQLAHTGTQFDSVERVQLLVDGEEVTELWGHLLWDEPFAADPFTLSPITFDSHRYGEQVPVGEVTVGGEANTFEATVELRLLGPNGDVIDETFTTATSGTGTRGTWEHTFFLEGAATWTIEAIEPDPSDGEGRPPFTTTLQLRSA